MTMDCSACDFDVTDITAYDANGNELTDGNLAAESLAVYDLVHGGDYTFIIEGAPDVSEGKFDCKIECTSDAPTTAHPSTSPTPAPSVNPSVWPTVSPSTDSPTTPAPTHPGEKTCDSQFSGSYNGEPMNVEVRMPYDGDLTMNCSGSDFDIGSLSAYDSDGNEFADVEYAASILTVHDLVHGGDYWFTIDGADYISSATFNCNIQCSSDAPTKSPTTEPTTEPTLGPTTQPTSEPTTDPTIVPTLSPTTYPTLEPTTNPTVDPTENPTSDPTVDPTGAPTGSPTNAPTSEPTDSPTTPAPTHPGELTCGSQDTGDYNGEPMEIEVRMPYDGDLSIVCSASDFAIKNITGYDSDGNGLTDSDFSAYVLTVHDLGHGGDYLFIVEGAVGVSSGTYDCTIYCSSDAPTKSPSTEPTTEPTSGPTTEPTADPTVDPTENPTADPTEDPTAQPTVDPTENPTSDPTADPTADPTVDPTSAPTVSPSDSPTESPTAAPTSEPTDSPTTPSPTHPGEKICGDEFNGTYHGEPMNVEVRMPYDGDMTMDC